MPAATCEIPPSNRYTKALEERDQQKLTPLLRLKYGAIQDAVADLGEPAEIGKTSAGFQRYLYTVRVA
jgi:type I restriction enzyme, R subunit